MGGGNNTVTSFASHSKISVLSFLIKNMNSWPGTNPSSKGYSINKKTILYCSLLTRAAEYLPMEN